MDFFFSMQYYHKWLLRSVRNRGPQELFVFCCFSNEGADSVVKDYRVGFRCGGQNEGVKPWTEEGSWGSMAMVKVRHNDKVSRVEGRYKREWYGHGDNDNVTVMGNFGRI